MRLAKFDIHNVIFLLLLGLISSICTLPSSAQIKKEMSEVQIEMEYAQRLAGMGLVDYAQMVLDRIDDPQIKKFAQLQNTVNMGKFDEAEKLINRQPNQESFETWRMKLILGDGYYAWGKYDKAKKVYESFFERYKSSPPADIKEFYISSAYKYAQMLLLMGDKKKAFEAYELLLGAISKDDKERRPMRRQLLSETADLLVELAKESTGSKRSAYFKRIEEISNEVMWVQDLWFGKMIVTLAHVKLIKGDIDGATSLIDDYRSNLISIDKALKEEGKRLGEDFSQFSPMAECRYLIGVMMHDEAKKLMEADGNSSAALKLLAGESKAGKSRSSGALQHMLNVFIKYPGTRWAPDAGERAEEIEKTLVEEFGARIKTNITRKQLAQVQQYQFSGARALFNQNQFEKATERYEKVLNMYPEDEMSVPAISDLAQCYMELDNNLYAEMAINYLAERFSARKNLLVEAGNKVLSLANKYETEKKMPEKKEAIYQKFFELFTEHPRTPGLLFTYGDEKYRNEDIEGALRYFTGIVARYQGSPFYYESLSKIAHCYAKLEQYDKEQEALQKYIEALETKKEPGQRIVYANYRMAYAYQRKSGDINLARAIKLYRKIQNMLKKNADKYQKNANEKKANEQILAGAYFNTGRCFSMLQKPEKKQKAYKAQAIRMFDKLVKDFPGSDFAPSALSQMGMLWTVLGNADQSEKSLRTLRKKYPDSEQAKNAIFALAKNLLEIGMRNRAVDLFKEMFAPENRGRFSERQILTAGRELLQAGEYEIALDGFESILKTAEKRTRIEPALLGKGKALTELGKYEEATVALDKLIEKYPSSKNIIEACLYASRAYGSMAEKKENDKERFGLFNEAVKRMQRVRKYTREPGPVARSDLGVARIAHKKALSAAEFGTGKKAEQYRGETIAAYQILMLTADSGNPEVRPYIEEAYNECIPVMLKAELWDDVISDCDNYIAAFPNGKYLLDIRQWQNRAKTRKVMEGGSPAEETTPASPKPDETANDTSGEQETDNE